MNQLTNNPGLTCPKCGFKIAVSINQLLSVTDVICPACGLKLSVDKEKSQNSLNALDTFNKKLQKAEK